ncbi:hypothetical protein ACLOJK_006306 [Asimina triloba]
MKAQCLQTPSSASRLLVAVVTLSRRSHVMVRMESCPPTYAPLASTSPLDPTTSSNVQLAPTFQLDPSASFNVQS